MSLYWIIVVIKGLSLLVVLLVVLSVLHVGVVNVVVTDERVVSVNMDFVHPGVPVYRTIGCLNELHAKRYD